MGTAAESYDETHNEDAKLEAIKDLVVAITSTIAATETDPKIILPALSLLAAGCAALRIGLGGYSSCAGEH